MDVRGDKVRIGPDDGMQALGLAIAGFGPLLVSALLIPLRQEVVGVNAALIFVVIVVLAAACGGRPAGIAAALVAAASYDFFFTRPYQSLKIDRADDIGTTLLLLVIGLVVAELVQLTHRTRRAHRRSSDQIARLHRVAEMVASGTPRADVVDAVEKELTHLLGLSTCTFEEPPFDSEPPTLERNGAIEGGRRRWVYDEFSLPAEGCALNVLHRGAVVGRLVLTAEHDVGVSIVDRVVAVALSDELGAAFDSAAAG
jgi:Domain of unknown function (DUF4118)